MILNFICLLVTFAVFSKLMTRRVYVEQERWRKTSFLLTLMVEHSPSNVQCNFVNNIASYYEMREV